jgi:hypothetical protein
MSLPESIAFSIQFRSAALMGRLKGGYGRVSKR